MSKNIFQFTREFVDPEKQEILEMMMRYTPAAIAMFDTEMRYIAASAKWIEDYELQGKTLKGVSHYEIFPEILFKQDWVDSHQLTLSGKVYSAPCDKFVRADGSVQYVRYENHPWYKQDGSIGGMIMFTEVITDEVMQRRELERQRKFLSKAQNIANVGYWRLDLESNNLFWSEEVYNIYGVDPLTFKPTLQSAIEAYHPRDRAAVEDMVKTAIERKESFDFRLRIIRPSDEIRLVRSHGECECDAQGHVIGIFGVFKDITEDRMPQFALRTAQQAEV